MILQNCSFAIGHCFLSHSCLLARSSSLPLSLSLSIHIYSHIIYRLLPSFDYFLPSFTPLLFARSLARSLSRLLSVQSIVCSFNDVNVCYGVLVCIVFFLLSYYFSLFFSFCCFFLFILYLGVCVCVCWILFFVFAQQQSIYVSTALCEFLCLSSFQGRWILFHFVSMRVRVVYYSIPVMFLRWFFVRNTRTRDRERYTQSALNSSSNNNDRMFVLFINFRFLCGCNLSMRRRSLLFTANFFLVSSAKISLHCDTHTHYFVWHTDDCNSRNLFLMTRFNHNMQLTNFKSKINPTWIDDVIRQRKRIE